MLLLLENSVKFDVHKIKLAKASAFGRRGYIPLPHPPPMASKLAMGSYAAMRLHRIILEHPPNKNPGYATGGDYPLIQGLSNTYRRGLYQMPHRAFYQSPRQMCLSA